MKYSLMIMTTDQVGGVNTIWLPFEADSIDDVCDAAFELIDPCLCANWNSRHIGLGIWILEDAAGRTIKFKIDEVEGDGYTQGWAFTEES